MHIVLASPGWLYHLVAGGSWQAQGVDVVSDRKRIAHLTTQHAFEELEEVAVDEQSQEHGQEQAGAASEPEQQTRDLQPDTPALTAEPSEADSFVQEPNVLVYQLSAKDDSIHQALAALSKQVGLFGFNYIATQIAKFALMCRKSQRQNRCSLLSQHLSPGQGFSLCPAQPSQLFSLCSSQPHQIAQTCQILPSLDLTTPNRREEHQQQCRVQPLKLLQQCN